MQRHEAFQLFGGLEPLSLFPRVYRHEKPCALNSVSNMIQYLTMTVLFPPTFTFLVTVFVLENMHNDDIQYIYIFIHYKGLL